MNNAIDQFNYSQRLEKDQIIIKNISTLLVVTYDKQGIILILRAVIRGNVRLKLLTIASISAGYYIIPIRT